MGASSPCNQRGHNRLLQSICLSDRLAKYLNIHQNSSHTLEGGGGAVKKLFLVVPPLVPRFFMYCYKFNLVGPCAACMVRISQISPLSRDRALISWPMNPRLCPTVQIL